MKKRQALIGQLEGGVVVRARRDEHFELIDFVSAHPDVAPTLGGPQFISAHCRDRFSFYVFRGGYFMFEPLGQGVVDVHMAVLPNYRRGPDLANACRATMEGLRDHKMASLIIANEGLHTMCAACEMPMITKLVGRFDPKHRAARGLARILKFREIESSTDRMVWEKDITCPLEQQQPARA